MPGAFGFPPDWLYSLAMTQAERKFISRIPGALGDPVALARLLWSAARRGHADAITALLEAGADPNSSSAATLPLEEAADADRVLVVERLLKAGADPNLGRTMARAGVQALPLLLKAGGRIDGPAGGHNPLLSAISTRRKQDRASALIGLCADVNVRDRCGATPLMLAAKHGRYQTFQQLLQHGADLLAVDFTGRSVARYAVEAMASGSVTPQSERPSVVRILRQVRQLSPAQPEDLLLVEMALGNAVELERQLRAGLHPDTRISGSINLLGMNLVEMLNDAHNWLEILKNQTMRQTVDEQVGGCTLLMWAIVLGQEQCIELLMNAGADVNARMLNGVSAADLSVHSTARIRKMVGTLAVDPMAHRPGELSFQPSEMEPPACNRVGRLGILTEKLDEYHAVFLQYHANYNDSMPSDYHLNGYWERACLFYLEEKLPEMRRSLEVVLELGSRFLREDSPRPRTEWVRSFTRSAAACAVLSQWGTLKELCSFPNVTWGRAPGGSWYDVEHCDWAFWVLFAEQQRGEPETVTLRPGIMSARARGAKLLLSIHDAIMVGNASVAGAAVRRYMTFHRRHVTSKQHGVIAYRAVSAEATLLVGIAKQMGLDLRLAQQDTDLLITHW